MVQTPPSPRILDSFGSGFRTAGQAYYLAALPLLLDLLFLTGRFVQTSYAYSFRIGVKFTLPFYFPSLTDVYDFPAQQGVSVQLTGFDIIPILGVGVILYTIVNAYVSAGYLGSLHSSITGMTVPPSFFSLAGKYFARILTFGLLWLALDLLGVLLLSSPSLFVAYFVILLALGYLLFLTPFIIVANNVPFSQAISASIRTTTSTRTLGYAILYALATVPVSILVYLILNIGILGFILATAGFAFVGTGLVASTFYFMARPASIQPLTMDVGG